MLALAYGLTWAEVIGVLSTLGSGTGAVVAAFLAVRRAKRETRAKVEHECLERIAKLRAGEQ